VPRSPLYPVPAKANSGRSSLSANQTTSFFLVSGFGFGAYSAKLLRMVVTGGPPVRGGGGMPHRIMLNSRPVSVLRTTGAR
jgi:hypothetical protein